MECSLFIELQKVSLNELKLVHENRVVLCATYQWNNEEQECISEQEKRKERKKRK
jgi:hypothetical protein